MKNSWKKNSENLKETCSKLNNNEFQMFYENTVRKDTKSDKKNQFKDDLDDTLSKFQKKTEQRQVKSE